MNSTGALNMRLQSVLSASDCGNPIWGLDVQAVFRFQVLEQELITEMLSSGKGWSDSSSSSVADAMEQWIA